MKTITLSLNQKLNMYSLQKNSIKVIAGNKLYKLNLN